MKNFLKKHKKLLFLPVVALFILAFVFWPRPQKELETHTIKEANLTQSLSATGTVDSEKSVDLNFLAGGKLVYLGVQKGDRVEIGQVIAVLDQRTMQKNLETALRNYSLQRNDFEQTKDDQNDHSPKDALNDKMKRILEDNQYDLEKAVISVELQQLAKEQSVLTAPIGGIVTRADAKSAGLNISSTTVFSVADPDNLVFKIDIDEADIGKVREGKSVKAVLDAYPDQTLDLSVSYIDFVSHTTTGGGSAFTAQSNLPQNPDFIYRIGMSGDAEVILDERFNILTVPLSSVTDDGYAYIKIDKNIYKKQKVRLGLKNDTDAEVINGLKAGDKVALDPAEAEKLSQKKKTLFLF